MNINFDSLYEEIESLTNNELDKRLSNLDAIITYLLMHSETCKMDSDLEIIASLYREEYIKRKKYGKRKKYIIHK